MTRKIKLIVIAMQLLMFAVPLGLVTYFSETHNWFWFGLLVFVSVVIFVGLQVVQAKPTLEYLKKLEASEFRLRMRFDEYGIADMYNMQSMTEMNERNSENAGIITRGNRFSLLSLSAASYIDPGLRRHWDSLKAKLETGSPLRLLILNPFCAEREVRDRLNNISTQYDSKFRPDLLVALYNRFPNVSIRFTSHNIYCAVFFSETEMMYDPYHLGKVEDRIENYFIAIKFINRTDLAPRHSYYKILERHFEFLWDTSEDIEVFFRKYELQLESAFRNKPPLKSRYAVMEG